MSTASERLGLPSPVWLGVMVLTCVAVGLLAGMSPEYGAMAAVGVVFAGVVITNLTVGFVIFTALSFLDLLSSSGSFSGTKLIGLLLFVSWAARIATQRRDDLAAFISENSGLFVALIAMLGWSALSFAWAESPSTALGGAGRYALNMLLIPIAFSAVRERKHLVWVLMAFVLGSVFSALYGFASSSAAGFGGRLTGTLGDPNAEATVFAASIPLVFGLIGVFRRSPRMKLVAVVSVFILFAGLVHTVSREGILAFAAVLIGAVVFGGRWRGRAATLLVIGAAATVGYFLVLAPLATRQRITMSDTSGRSSIWTVAWRVVKAHPVLGVGNDNFILIESQYVNQPGAVDALYIVTEPKVAHDTYLEELVDLGVPGLLLFLAVVALSLRCVVRATRIFERVGDRDMELISRTVFLALAAELTTAAFVSQEYAKYLWIVLALCPVLLRLARRTEARIDSIPIAGL